MAIKAFFFSFFFVLIITPLIRLFAINNHIVDAPDGKIKKQKEPVPYLGGAALYSGFLVSLFLFLPLQGCLLFFLFGLSILFFLGLIDDLWMTTPLQKFIGQMFAAASFLIAGFSLKGVFLSSWGNSLLSFFWILSVVNAFNLVDVMDGLATLLALCATLSFLVFSILFGLSYVTLLLSIFSGCLLGFFYYNKPAAALYLGDAGALFIGGFLAVMPFFFNWGFYSFNGFLVPCIILAIPLLESFSLIIIRTYKGKPFYYGSPDHYCLYLLDKGWTKNEILFFSGVIALGLFGEAYLVAFGLISTNQIIYTAVAGISFLTICIFSPFFSRNQLTKNVAFCRSSVAKHEKPLT